MGSITNVHSYLSAVDEFGHVVMRSSLLLRIAATCMILLHMGLLLQLLLFSHQLFFKKVVLKTSDDIYLSE